MKKALVEFYLEDLVDDKQQEIMDILGDDFDYENDPILEIDFTVYEGDEYGEDDRSQNAGLDFFGNRHRRG